MLKLLSPPWACADILWAAECQVGTNYFRIHPKGVGLVCTREGGLPALTFVEEYLGEVHTPWRWFEMQVRLPLAQASMRHPNLEVWPTACLSGLPNNASPAFLPAVHHGSGLIVVKDYHLTISGS